VRVASAKENLKDFEGVAIESITGDLSFTIQITVLQSFLSITIIGFPQLRSRENFEGLANLTELVVSLSHVLWVLQGMEGDGKNTELLGNILVASI